MSGIDELIALSERATPGDWVPCGAWVSTRDNDSPSVCTTSPKHWDSELLRAPEDSQANANFIATLVNWFRDNQAALSARAGGDDYVMVPKQMHVDADAWEAASFAFGGPATGPDEEYMDCTLWVGEIEQDDGSKLHGLHVSCDECPEEGCITLATFPAALASQAVGVKDGR